MSLELLEERQAFAAFSFSAGVATLTLEANENGALNANILTATGGVAVDMTTLTGLATFNVVGDAGNETFTLSNPLNIADTLISSNIETLQVNGSIGAGAQWLQFLGGNVQLVGGTTINLASFDLGAGTSINGNAALSITTTSALALYDVGVGTPLANLTVTAPSVTLKGDVTVVGLFDVNTSAVVLTGDVAINGGDVQFDAGAKINGAKSLSITTGSHFSAPIFGNTTPLASLALTSAGNVVLTESIRAATLKVHSGTDGAGGITAGAGVTITAGAQTYVAGDGPGGANGANVDLSTNGPTFAGAIAEFRIELDAAFASNALPTAAQFSTAPPTNYTVISRAGGITILSGDGSRVSNAAGGTLLLSGLGSVTLLDSIDRGAGTILLQSTGNSVSQNGSSAVTAGTLSARASTGIVLDVATNVASNVALQSNTGNVRYKGQGNITLSQVAASADYAGAAGMRSNTGNIRIESTTAGASVTQTSASPIEGNGLELVGANSAFQLATASNQIVTIAGAAGGAGISQIIFRDTSGDLAVGTVGATSGLSAGIGIALQSDSGSITQSQAIAASDFGVVAATGINLGTQTNNVGELSARTTTGDVRFKNQSGLVIGSVGAGLGFGGASGVSTPALFSLEIASAGTAVIQTTTRIINAASVELLGPVDFNLGTNANAAGALAVGGAASIVFRNSGDLKIDTVDGTAGVAAATVKLQSDAGDITQSATGAIAATTLGARAATGVDLSTAKNAVATTVALQTAAGDVRFKNDGGFTIGAVAAGGGFSGATGIQAPGIININQVAAAAAVVSQTQIIQGDGGLVLLGALTDYQLALANDVDVLAGDVGKIAFTDLGDLEIGTVDGTVGLTAATGDLTVSAGATLTTTTLTNATTADVLLTSGTDLTIGAAVTAGVQAKLVSTGAMAINGAVDGGATTIVDAGTSLTTTAGINAGTTTTVTSGTTMSIGATVNAGATTTVDAGTSLTTTAGINAGTTATVTSGTTMSIGGLVNAGATTTVDAGSSLTTTALISAGTTTTVTSVGDMSIGAGVEATKGAATVTSGGALTTTALITGELTASVTGAKDVAIGGGVTSRTQDVVIISTGGDLTVTSGVAAGTAAGLTSSGAMTISGGTITSGGDADVTLTNGAALLLANSTVDAAGQLLQSTSNSVTLNGATVNAVQEIVFNGAVTVSGSSTLDNDGTNAVDVDFNNGLTVADSTLAVASKNAVQLNGTTELEDGVVAATNGAVILGAGQLIGTGTMPTTLVHSGATLAPGVGVDDPDVVGGADIGAITFDGDLVLAAGSKLVVTMDGADPVLRDQVVVGAGYTAVVTDAILELSLGEFELDAGARIPIIDVATGDLTPAFLGLNDGDRLFPGVDGPRGELIIRYNLAGGADVVAPVPVPVADVIPIPTADGLFVFPSVPMFLAPGPALAPFAVASAILFKNFETEDFGGGSLDFAVQRLRLEIDEVENVDSEKVVRRLLGGEGESGVVIRASDLAQTLAEALGRARPGDYRIKIDVDPPREGEERTSDRIHLRLTLENQKRIFQELVGRFDSIAKVVDFLRTLEKAEKAASQPSPQGRMQHAAPSVDVRVGALPAALPFLQFDLGATPTQAAPVATRPQAQTPTPRETAVEHFFSADAATEQAVDEDLPLAAGLTLPLFVVAALRRKKANASLRDAV